MAALSTKRNWLMLYRNVEGVELHICKYSTDGTIYKEISGNNYTAVGGSFVTVNLRNTLNYVV